MSMHSGPTVPLSTGSSTFLSPLSTITLFLSATTRSWILGCLRRKQQLSHNRFERERDESPDAEGRFAGSGNDDGRLRGRRGCCSGGLQPPGTQAFAAP